MINEVRNTVMAVLNKDNNGYVTPEEFNLFARQAQLELFEEYFYDYSQSVVLMNNRRYNSGYSDIPKQTEEVIDTFSLESGALGYAGGVFTLPTDWYTIISAKYNGVEIEKVSQSKVLYLTSSNLTAPTTAYPAYHQNGATATALGNTITVYPSTINANVTVVYVRYPLAPKWTYNTVAGSPVFNQAAADYQDFEMPSSDMPTLVNKILQMAGMNIREQAVTQYGMQEEAIEDQKEV
tara:strand:+ start:14435 stop:15145 length:711 start_codon:yes stop_codon:yes gene_type:complete